MDSSVCTQMIKTVRVSHVCLFFIFKPLNVMLVHIFWRIHICLVVHEYKHDSKNHLTHGSFQCRTADWHPHRLQFLCDHLQRRRWWVCGALFLRVLAKFTSHLGSPESGNWGFACPSGPLSPPSWSQSAMWEPLFQQHLRNKSDTLLTAAYSEAGGQGIT